jgi:alkanesulfonate monooxygenase SsuD/methylene tetrahydromethanopterin reductase-like flavin-dependent oxidoreductase (luciferase family)
MVAQGRKPSDCKVLFLINPILGETMEEAKERKKKREAIAFEKIDERLAHFGKVTNIDFGKFDLDKPLPDDVTTNGHQLNLEQFRNGGRTLNPPDHGELQRRRPVDRPRRYARLRGGAHGRSHAGSRRHGHLLHAHVNRRTLAEIEDAGARFRIAADAYRLRA